MLLCNIFGVFALVFLAGDAFAHHLSNKSVLYWAKSAESSMMNAGLMFGFAQQGLASYNKNKYPKMVDVLAKKTARFAGLLGATGALFSFIMAFIPDEESPELTKMKFEFPKLNDKIDAVARSLDDTKDLIESKTQQAAYIKYEHNINEGFSQLQLCMRKLENVTCSNQTDCNRKKISVAQGYITSMNIRKDMEAIFEGVTSDSVFGRSLLIILKEESKCDVPKISMLTNKITSLITKAMTVTIFHNYVTKTDYNVLDDTSNIKAKLRMIENKRQSIQDMCFKNINTRLAFDIRNAHTGFLSDVQKTNTFLIKLLKKKYPWTDFHVLTFSGDKEPKIGAVESHRRQFWSSSKAHKMHAVVIPTNNASVVDLAIKIEEWKNLTELIEGPDDIKTLTRKIMKNAVLDSEVQSYAILPGNEWVLGYYTENDIKQHTLGTDDVTHMNVFVNRPRQSESFLVAVSFQQAIFPMKCSESNPCNGHGDCYVYPYSTQIGCKCDDGYSGDNCESSERNVQLQSVINSLLENTVKLPTFTSIQHGLEDAHMSLTAASDNIQESINNLEATINDKFRSMGELVSNKFEEIEIIIRYQNAIEDVQYFSKLANPEYFYLQHQTSIDLKNLSTYPAFKRYSSLSSKDIANFLLHPTGIKWWLHQLNYLIVGRKDIEFTSHKPLIFLVMDRLKDRLCFQDYKDEVTRTFRQLMLLQYKGFILWGKAHSSVYTDSYVVSSRYAKVLWDQIQYLDSATCSVNIPHSRSLQDCHGGYFIHKSMDVNVACNDGYFPKGPNRIENVSHWVDTVIEASSESSDPGWASEQVVGPADVSADGKANAWAPSETTLLEEQFLHVMFSKSVFPMKVMIYETFNAGSVKRVDVMDPNDEWHMAWETDTVQDIQGNRTLSIKLERTNVLTNQLKIFMHLNSTSKPMHIDAIELHGVSQKDTCSVLESTQCTQCNCDTEGSVSSVCKQNGECQCKEKYYGAKCNNRDCEMTSWSGWNNTCRCGYRDPRTRTRSVLHPAKGNGSSCPPAAETTNCPMVSCNCAKDFPGYYGDRCDNKDCVWSSWSAWSTCKKCGDINCYYPAQACPDFEPQKTRSRNKEIPKEGGGQECAGDTTDTNGCGYTCTMHCSGALFYICAKYKLKG